MKKSWTKHKNLSGFYIAPAMAVLILCLILPLFYTIYCSLFKLDYLVNGGFVGMKNYVTLLTDRKVQDSLLLTLGITLISTLLSVLLGLAMALWIDRKTGFFAYLIEMLGLVPWVISMVVAGLLWRWLFHGDLGLFNMILRMLGLNPVYVVQNKIPAIIALIFVMVWRLVSNFTNNTVPKVLTGGGPSNATNVITLYQYNLGFQYYKFGTSAALSVLIMLITSLIIVLYIKVSNYRI